jgi:uncharacterized protein YwgA
MTEREQIVAAIISAAGGQMISRVRLQKTVYLLDQLGLESGFEFDYHHFGPFSRNLDNATTDAKELNIIKEDIGHRTSDGASYSIFELIGDAPLASDIFQGVGLEKAKELVQNFASTSVTVLELAATIDWLWRFEKCRDWATEIKRRKGPKVENGRLDKAIELLNSIGLKPQPSQAA